jgi:hypothetical protein
MSKNSTNGVSGLMNKLIEENGYSGKKLTQEWKEVDELYFAIAHSIVDVLTEVRTATDLFKEEHELVSQETIITINSINQDLDKFSEELVQIRERHEGKTGVISPDSEDMVICMSVYNDYVILSDRFKALTFPAMLNLTEAMIEISQKKKLQDPGVVSDVVIKEVDTAVTNETTTEEDKDKVNV